MQLRKMTDGELMTELGIQYSRMTRNFRVDKKEWDKARAQYRRIKLEIKRREDESAKLLDQAETPALEINDWSDIPFLSEDEIETGEIF